MPVMLRLLLLSSLLVLPACGGEAAAAPSPDGTLELTVGGDARSLVGDLRELDVELLPQREPQVPAPRLEPPQTGSPHEQLTPEPQPEPPPPEPDYFTVELKQGQTIGALAKEHLGTSRRYQEILDLNHLTEAAARKLRPGAKIRIPKQQAAATGR